LYRYRVKILINVEFNSKSLYYFLKTALMFFTLRLFLTSKRVIELQ